MTATSPAAPAWWSRFWFAPESPYNLAGARIVIALQALWVLLSRDLSGASALPPEFWRGVTWADRWRYLLFPGHQGLESFLEWVAVIALIALALGLYPRFTALLSGLLLYHLAPLESIIWTPAPYERGFEVAILSLIVLAVAPCADVWALGRGPTPARDAGEYRWPLLLTQLFLAQVYFFSGYSKLFRVGPGWASAVNIRHWLLLFNQEDQVSVFHSLGLTLARHPGWCLAIGLGAALFELTFPVVLFSKRSRLFYIPAAALMHIGILLSMNIAFLNAPQLLVFVSWDRLIQRHVKAPGPRGEPRQPPEQEAVAQPRAAPGAQAGQMGF